MLKIGLVVGREWSFPPAFIEEVQRRDEGVSAEFVKRGGTAMDEPVRYDVIIDRISHEVPYYRTYLKYAALQGAVVVNNPFMWSADDKLFGAALAAKLGIASPKTIALPNKEYVPGIKHDDTSGRLTMIVQEFIEWDQFVRCIALGQRDVLPIKYDPKERKYHVEHDHLSPELGRRIVNDSLTLMRALGYDMCSLEWAVRDGVPYAIDFMNPAPDMDLYSLTPHYFQWAVTKMADMAIRLAKEPKPDLDLRRGEFLLGRRELPPRPPARIPDPKKEVEVDLTWNAELGDGHMPSARSEADISSS